MWDISPYSELEDRSDVFDLFKKFILKRTDVNSTNWKSNATMAKVFGDFRIENGQTYTFTDLELYSEYYRVFDEKFNGKVEISCFTPVNSDDEYSEDEYGLGDFDSDNEFGDNEEDAAIPLAPEIEKIVEKYKQTYQVGWFDRITDWFKYNINKVNRISDVEEWTSFDEIDKVYNNILKVFADRRKHFLSKAFVKFVIENIDLIDRNWIVELESSHTIYPKYISDIEEALETNGKQ